MPPPGGMIDRDANGALRYAWKANTPPLGPADQAKLIKKGKMAESEALLGLRDVETGTPILAHSGSVNSKKTPRRTPIKRMRSRNRYR